MKPSDIALGLVGLLIVAFAGFVVVTFGVATVFVLLDMWRYMLK